MSKSKPIWVVTLSNLSKTKPKKDKVIVRAENIKGAIATAKANSITFRNVRCHGTAYIAHPVMDLSMTKTSTAALKKFNLLGYS